MGDFNNVLCTEERIGGLQPSHIEFLPFQQCLAHCGVEDMKGRGRVFTWSNGTIQSRIDRALINLDWMAMFPGVEAYFASERLSDHALIILNVTEERLRPKRQFKFLNIWALDVTFSETVAAKWGTNIQGTAQF